LHTQNSKRKDRGYERKLMDDVDDNDNNNDDDDESDNDA